MRCECQYLNKKLIYYEYRSLLDKKNKTFDFIIDGFFQAYGKESFINNIKSLN